MTTGNNQATPGNTVHWGWRSPCERWPRLIPIRRYLPGIMRENAAMPAAKAHRYLVSFMRMGLVRRDYEYESL
ncbi:MAG: helix-turn-helix domain-containing protein [Propionivibrio sp.]|nr:helix-turn-helix domain-containing protein [Propionivibrio sp.]